MEAIPWSTMRMTDLTLPSVLSEMDLTLLLFHVMQSLELWDIREKNTMTFNNAHDGLVAALASSSATGKVASVSHDRTLKLWK
jgi:WD40 repeat protein